MTLNVQNKRWVYAYRLKRRARHILKKFVTIQLTFYQKVLDRVFAQIPRISDTLGALL